MAGRTLIAALLLIAAIGCSSRPWRVSPYRDWHHHPAKPAPTHIAPATYEAPRRPAPVRSGQFDIAEARQRFLVETVEKLRKLRIHVRSVDTFAVYRMSFEHGVLRVGLPLHNATVLALSETERDYVLRTIRDYKDRRLWTRSFEYGLPLTHIRFDRGHLELPGIDPASGPQGPSGNNRCIRP